MRDAVQEKAFLLLDDLARHLDDRALALVERADEPVGARELFGQPRLALHRGALSQLGIIAAVAEQARPRAAVNLDRPALHGPANIEVGDDCRRAVAAEFERSEEHTSELQYLMRTSYAVFC